MNKPTDPSSEAENQEARKTTCPYCGHYIWHPAWAQPGYQEPTNKVPFGQICPKSDCSCRQHRDL